MFMALNCSSLHFSKKENGISPFPPHLLKHHLGIHCFYLVTCLLKHTIPLLGLALSVEGQVNGIFPLQTGNYTVEQQVLLKPERQKCRKQPIGRRDGELKGVEEAINRADWS